MLKDITIGQYFPGDTVLHKLDPRIKILIVTLYIISLFFIRSFHSYIYILAFILLAIYISKVPFNIILKGLKPLRFIIILTFLINIFMTKGQVLFSLGPLMVTKEGLSHSIFMVLRIVFLITGTSLLTLTTSPIALTDGIESLLGPFKRIGLPAHELAMMMTIALRFIPTLLEEADKILKAQQARGADFESGNISQRAKNLIPLLVPLFINSFRRADDLAIAMESRCYIGGDGRTSLNELKLENEDMLILGASSIFFIFIILTR